MSNATKELAGALSEVAAEKSKEMAEAAKTGLLEAIENMDEKYAKETLATLFPVLSLPVKLLIAFMGIVGMVISGLMAYEVHLHPEQFDIYDMVAILSLPFVGILLLAAIPIKSLAYSSALLGAEVLRNRIQQNSEHTTKSGEKVTVEPDTVEAAAADKPADLREQTNSEHRRP